MKRTGPPKRSSWKRRQTNNAWRRREGAKRKRQREWGDDRPAFRAEFTGTPCWNCGWGIGFPAVGKWRNRLGMQVDHIAGRIPNDAHRRENLAWLCNWCNCHEKPGVERMLWIKRRFDPDYYDRSVVLRIRGKADSHVTEDEVDANR